MDVRRYRKRMLSLWRRKERFEISEQRHADQIKLVQQNQWLMTVQIEEMKRKIMETDHFERNISWEQDPNITGSDDSQRVEETDGKQLNRNNEEVANAEDELDRKKRIKQIMALRKWSEQK